MQTREQVIKGMEDLRVVYHSNQILHPKDFVNQHDMEVIDNALALLKAQDKRVIGRWKQLKGDFTTPGGTPYYVCGACGDSGHLNGCEYPRRKVICDTCGRINLYPWEKAYEEGSSLWENDEEAVKQDG